MAVDRFLAAMKRATERSYPAWLAVLEDGLADCTLNYETHRAVFDMHPLEDYYFAAAVGLEAARIRPLFTKAQANVLLAEIAAKVDASAGRTDRIVSDLVFTIVSQVDLTIVESQRQPHDHVIEIILRRMGIAFAPETKELMSDLLFRHHLAEPLALEIPLWWPAFKEKIDLSFLPEEVSVAELKFMPEPARIASAAAAPPPPRRRRAQSII
jgi:hypothetical protein